MTLGMVIPFQIHQQRQGVWKKSLIDNDLFKTNKQTTAPWKKTLSTELEDKTTGTKYLQKDPSNKAQFFKIYKEALKFNN